VLVFVRQTGSLVLMKMLEQLAHQLKSAVIITRYIYIHQLLTTAEII